MSLPPLNAWDWFVLITLAISCAYGLLMGLSRTLFGLASWVAALVGTPLLAPSLIEAFQVARYGIWIWMGLFVVLFLVVRMLGALLARGLKASGLGGVDRLGGALFGLVRAGLLIVLVVAGARMLGADHGPGWREATCRPLLDALSHLIEPYLPQRVSGIRTT